MRSSTRLVGLCVLLCALFGGASAAQAACYGSTPAAVSFADSGIDAQGGVAPEITTVQGTLDGRCNYSVVPGLTRSLISGDSVFIYIDRDGNPITGGRTPTGADGADIVVATLGVSGAQGPPAIGVWNGSLFDFTTDPNPVGAAGSDGGFSASVDRLGIRSGALTWFYVVTRYRGVYDYFDFGPNPGVAPPSLLAAFSTTPPPPPPPPPPPLFPPYWPVVQQPTAKPRPDESACKVPDVRGKTRSAALDRLLNAHCDLASTALWRYSNSVRKGRVIATTPRAGSRTTRDVRLVLSKGRRKSRARAAAVEATALPKTVLTRLQELANSLATRP
jgi:hypothetical protein